MKAKEELLSQEKHNAAPHSAPPDVASAEAPSEEGDRVAELEKKVSSLEDQLLRAKADLQNFQKRAARERSDAIVYGNAELMKSLLGVLDDFERSIKALDGGADPVSVMQGVKLTHDNLRKTLSEQGLEEIPAIGRAFDPSIHEALLHQPTKDHMAGTVIDVIVRGYRLRDRVVRPTRVVVAKAIDADAKHEGSASVESQVREGECAADGQTPVAKE